MLMLSCYNSVHHGNSGNHGNDLSITHYHSSYLKQAKSIQHVSFKTTNVKPEDKREVRLSIVNRFNSLMKMYLCFIW